MHLYAHSLTVCIADNWREYQVILQIFSQGSVYNGEVVRAQITIAIPAKHALI